MRRTLLLLLLLALTGIGAWQLFRQMRPAEPGADPWSAVPANAAVIIALPDVRSFWEQWTRTAQLATVFARTTPGQALDRVFNRLKGDEVEGTAHMPAILAFVRRADGSTAYCIALASAEPDHLPGFAARLDERVNTAALARGGTVQLRPDTALPELFASIHKGLLLLSSDQDLLDGMMRRAGFPTSDRALTHARTTLGRGADAHMLLRTSEGWPALEQWIRPEVMGTQPCGEGWAALDVRIRPEALLLSGVFLGPDSTGPMGSAEPFVQEDLLRALPAEVTILDMRRPEVLEHQVAAHASDSVKSFLWGSLGGPSATGSGYIAEDSLAHWLVMGSVDTAATTSGLDVLDGPGSHAPRHRGYRVHHAPAMHVFADSGWARHLEWAVLLGDHLVIADAPGAARHAIDAYLDGGTLAQDLRTSELLQRNASPALRTIWCDLGRGQTQLTRLATPSTAATMTEYTDLWSELGGLLFQVRRKQKGMSYVHLSVQHAPISRPVDRTRWSLPLTTPLLGVPQMIRNHASGMGEVLMQDSTGRLLLISTGGQVLWERALDGPLRSPAVQVDRFRNGKLQLLLGTAGKIHLIDRNGVDVTGFPVSLPAKASAELAVVDYEQDGHYRILVPLEDGRLLNIGPDGKAVEGWAPAKLPVMINSAVRHLRIKGKDHLLFSDANGRVHVLDRRGAPRISKGPELGKNAVLIAAFGGSDLRTSQVIYLDGAGQLSSLDLEGKGERIGRTEDGQCGVFSDATGQHIWWLDGDTLWTRSPEGTRSRISHDIADARKAQPIPGKDGVWQVLAGEPSTLHLIDAHGGTLMPPTKAIDLGAIGDLDKDGELDLVIVTPDRRLTARRVAR